MHQPNRATDLPRPRPRADRGGAGRLERRRRRPARLSMPERRRQLIDAALRVFADRGFSGATTREIAVAAGVTEAVIFQHFADKDSLYAAILAQKAGELGTERWIADMQARRAAGDDEGVIRALFEGLLNQYDRDPHFLRLMVYSALEHHPLAGRLHGQRAQLYEFLCEFVTEGQRAGRFRRGAPAVLVRGILALPVYYLLQRRLFQTPWPPVKPAELLESGVPFVLAGLTGAAGRGEKASCGA